MLQPSVNLIEAHVLAAARVHGDDTTVPALARGKTDIARSGLTCVMTPLWQAGAASGDVLQVAGSFSDRLDDRKML